MVGSAVAFLLGIAFSFCLYGAVSRYRTRWTGTPVQTLLSSRLYHVIVGWVLGYTCLPALNEALLLGVVMSAVFLAGWSSMAFGCSVDWRVIKGMSLQTLRAEAGQVAVLLGALAGALFLTKTGTLLGGGGLLALGGIMAMSLPQSRGNSKNMRMRGQAHRTPSLSIGIGMVLLGVGSLQMRSEIPIVLYLPFANPILLEGLAGRAFCCLGIGAAVGLIVDLVTRGTGPRYFAYLVGAGILLGVGMGVNVAVEPVWIGLVAGIWIIHTTLHRVEILRLAEGGATALQICSLSTAGLLIGSQPAEGLVSGPLFGMSLALFVGLPAIRLVGERMAGPVRRQRAHVRRLFDLGDLGLVGVFALTIGVGPGFAATVACAWLLSRTLYTLIGDALTDAVLRLLERPVAAGISS